MNLRKLSWLVCLSILISTALTFSGLPTAEATSHPLIEKPSNGSCSDGYDLVGYDKPLSGSGSIPIQVCIDEEAPENTPLLGGTVDVCTGINQKVVIRGAMIECEHFSNVVELGTSGGTCHSSPAPPGTLRNYYREIYKVRGTTHHYCLLHVCQHEDFSYRYVCKGGVDPDRDGVTTVKLNNSGYTWTPPDSGECGGRGRTFLGIPSWDRGLKSCDNITIGDLTSENEATNPILIVTLNILEAITRIAGILAIAFLIIAGYWYALSEGDPQKAASAQKTAINALIGLCIVVLGVVMIRVAFKLFGVDV